jgi:hypothetical protein
MIRSRQIRLHEDIYTGGWYYNMLVTSRDEAFLARHDPVHGLTPSGGTPKKSLIRGMPRPYSGGGG